jgi:hypothetical protein
MAHTKTTTQARVPAPTAEHELFFKFLLLSPTYRLAHRILIGENDRFIPSPPRELHLVMRTYKLCGNIWEMDFDNWWINVGHKVLAVDKKPVIYKVDTTESQEKIIENFKVFLRNQKGNQSVKPNKKIQFLRNKIRPATLFERFLLINDYACNLDLLNYDFQKKMEVPPHWLAAYLLRESIPSLKQNPAVKDVEKFLKFEKIVSKPYEGNEKESFSKKCEVRKFIGFKSHKDEYTKKYLTMLMSKHLKEALYISENAARGRFPSREPLENCLEFDYPDLRFLLGEYAMRFILGDADLKNDNPGLSKFLRKMKTWDKLLKKFGFIEQRQIDAIKKEYEEKLEKAWQANLKLVNHSK